MFLAKALEGKDVKDLLTNIGSGAGSAPAASGAVAAEAAPAEEAKEEKKEDGTFWNTWQRLYGEVDRWLIEFATIQRRSPTRTWVSVFSTKRLRSIFSSVLYSYSKRCTTAALAGNGATTLRLGCYQFYLSGSIFNVICLYEIFYHLRARLS